MKIRYFLPLFLTAAVLGGCSATVQSDSGGLPDRDPELAYRLVKEEGALVLDVRTPGEFLSVRLPGARNIPIEQLPQRLQEVERLVNNDKKRPIVVYCTVGTRAAQAKRILLAAGFPNVTNLGGFSDWPRHR